MKFWHVHGDTARKTLTRKVQNIPAEHSPTPPHIVASEMSMQSDMAERGRRLRAAAALKEENTFRAIAKQIMENPDANAVFARLAAE